MANSSAPLRLVGVDVETANRNRNSICAIGVAPLGMPTFRSLVRPPTLDFVPEFIELHGIRPEHVVNAPPFASVMAQVQQVLEGAVFVAHNAEFDVACILAASAASAQPVFVPPMLVLDTLPLARATWPRMVDHKLSTIAAKLQIPLRHHDPASDAEAAVQIVLHAMRAHGASSVEQLASRKLVELVEFPRVGGATVAPVSTPVVVPQIPFAGRSFWEYVRWLLVVVLAIALVPIGAATISFLRSSQYGPGGVGLVLCALLAGPLVLMVRANRAAAQRRVLDASRRTEALAAEAHARVLAEEQHRAAVVADFEARRRREAEAQEAQARAWKRELVERFGEEAAARLLRREIWQGMTREMLIASRGEPEAVDERVMKTKTKHTFKYERETATKFAVKVNLEDGVVVGWTL